MSIVSLEREQSITEIEAQIRQGTEIPFLQTRVDMPPLPRRRLLILHTFLEHLGWPLQRRQAACAAAGKAQWGLDIHEQISSGALDRYGEVKRQLSVLAGDLFSSQYYANLSQRGETQMIQQIARGISEVNEAKMEWYQMALRKSPISPGHLPLLAVIYGRVFTAFAVFSDRNALLWRGVMEAMIVADRLSAKEGTISAWTDLQAALPWPGWQEAVSSAVLQQIRFAAEALQELDLKPETADFFFHSLDELKQNWEGFASRLGKS